MLSFYDERAKKRRARTELYDGELVAPFESPERVDMILARIRDVSLGEVRPISLHGLEPIVAVHDASYVKFLERIWHEWVRAGNKGEAIPLGWPTRRTRSDFVPHNIEGQLGYYALAGETSIEGGTWDAARASADTALSALDHVLEHQDAAFGLCRPPGHHAAVDQFGGYCFFNNAAITAQAARQRGIERVAILDVDYHHGNGTQQLFYDRDDVFFASLHCTPLDAFPYYLGLDDERGEGAGEGYNENHALPSGASYATWLAALGKALDSIARFDPGLLIVSLGVDTYEGDPIGSFKLKSPDFSDYGRRIRQLGLPTLFLMEGGYAVEAIGVNVVNVLTGFEQG